MQITFLIPVLVSAVGLLLIFRLKFFFILHPLRTARRFFKSLSDREARRSLTLALAGTLGVGNIFGVAAGLMIAGEGMVFWLLLSSLFSMVIKYSETLLVFDTPECRAGMSGALGQIFSRAGVFIAPIYALLTLLLSLFMGAALQSTALADTAYRSLEIPHLFTALFLALLVLPCTLGGGRKIENVTEIVIPMTTIIYILMSFAVIFIRFDKFPTVLSKIVNGAFQPRALVCGGITGGFLLAVKEGFARGILSNEAGAGTSALGHSRSQCREPSVAGLYGMCEVFFDTTLICTLTALVILMSVEDISAFSTPMSLVLSAFVGTLGDFSGYLLLILVFLFAYSTVICWYSYGSECIAVCFPRLKPLFTPAFLSFVVLSTKIPEGFLISATDVLLLFMSLITLSAIIKRREKIAGLTKFQLIWKNIEKDIDIY